ncbi:MAG: DUF839 domain-containing protein [Acidobacteria bacterium]|nr:DUF839 domain-containing protein [Acidobacteriota bacterium]
MSDYGRRAFIAGSLSAGVALAMQRLVARGESFTSGSRELMAGIGTGAYGDLKPVPSNNTGEKLLALPPGFQYTVFGKTGERLSDGSATPRNHDGMAAFSVGRGPKRELRLIRNHEINNLTAKAGITIGDASKSYDPLAGGGTTTLVIDPATREIRRHFVSLSGTLQNCAGGPTPWGSWVSCEETVLGIPRIKDTKDFERGGFSKPHGYCFEVFAAEDGLKQAAPLKALGRFVHEAIAVDPRSGIIYETEDRGTAGFYRFIPNRKAKLIEGGKLQMLAVKGKPKFDTRTGQKQGVKYDAAWVDIPDPDPAEADTNDLAVYQQGIERGAATFARLEGCWYGRGSIFFTSTSGGDKRRGQVWEYSPSTKDGGILTLIFESPDAAVLDGPDNLCVSPRGGLVLCEDGSGEQFVRGLTIDGRIFDFAKNIVQGFENKEFAGATFSPDGQTLFFNIQTPGLTFAVWGPWNEGAL